MRHLILPLLLAALAAGIFSGCQKTCKPSDKDPDPALIQAAKNYFQQSWQNAPAAAPDPNPRNTGARIPDWAHARVIRLPNTCIGSNGAPGTSPAAPSTNLSASSSSITEAILVPIHYSKPFYLGTNFGGIRQYPIDELAHLVIYKDSARAFHAEMVTALPDSNYKDHPIAPFSGILLVDRWDGQPLARYKYDGQGVRAWFPYRGSAATQRQIIPDDLIIQTCFEIGGYNYAPSAPGTDYAWSESIGCSNQFISGVPGAALLSAANYAALAPGGPSSASLQAIYPGDGGIVDGTGLTFQFDALPGIDLSQYFKCFTYIPDHGATYSVTLCTDIPVDNNPGALLSSNFHPGHTFIILTKTNGTVSLSQSFGFYPNNSILSIGGQYMSSKIKDDGAADHQYDASISMPNISQLDFQTVENLAVTLANSQQYSLYNYNCTDYALQVFNSIRVNTPIAVSDWIGSYTGIDFGKTPNGLYETLVGMQTFPGGVFNPLVRVGSFHAPASSGACN